MMTDLDHIDLFIRNDLNSTAEWRRDKAIEHPTDKRNNAAAEILERLASDADLLAGTKLYADFRQAIDAYDDDRLTEYVREAGEYRSRIGFSLTSDPVTIEDYLVGLFAIIDKDVRFI